MEDRYLQALIDALDGSKKLASYAYDLIKEYFSEDSIEDGIIISPSHFDEWARDMADTDEWYYICYWSLYDYAHDQPPYGDADWLFEKLLLAYVEVYSDENFDLSNAIYQKGDKVDIFDYTLSKYVEFIVQTKDGDYLYYFMNRDGDYEPHSYDYEDGKLK